MPTSVTNGRAQAMRTRNMALLSVSAVLAGGWLLFRAQSPNSRDVLVSDRESKLMNGEGGDRSGRAPITTSDNKKS